MSFLHVRTKDEHEDSDDDDDDNDDDDHEGDDGDDGGATVLAQTMLANIV